MFTFIKKDNSINLREHEFNRFAVIAYYNSEFVRICKSIVGHEWDAETKTWFLPKDCYHEFKGKISDKNFEIGRDLTEEEVKSRNIVVEEVGENYFVKKNEATGEVEDILKNYLFSKSKNGWVIKNEQAESFFQSMRDFLFELRRKSNMNLILLKYILKYIIFQKLLQHPKL